MMKLTKHTHLLQVFPLQNLSHSIIPLLSLPLWQRMKVVQQGWDIPEGQSKGLTVGPSPLPFPLQHPQAHIDFS